MKTVKLILVLLVLSLLGVWGHNYVAIGLQHVLHWHSELLQQLARFFADDDWGRLSQRVLALTLVPIGLGGVIALLYGIVKRRELPGLTCFMWTIWLITATVVFFNHG